MASVGILLFGMQEMNMQKKLVCFAFLVHRESTNF